MPTDPKSLPEYLTATVELSIAGRNVRLEAPVPTAPMRPAELMPLFNSLSDTLLDLTVKSVEDEGAKISCKHGCAACCRQLVAISPTEARHVHKLVNEMPEPRRSKILARFEDARRRLEEAGLLGKLMVPDQLTDEETELFGVKYFSKAIACPFLENETCSIYADRPTGCREHLVTTPAENCAHPTPETVHRVKMAMKVSTALWCMTLGHPDGETWVPLVVALSWVEAHPDESALCSGTELVSEFFSFLKLKEVPGTGGARPPDESHMSQKTDSGAPLC